MKLTKAKKKERAKAATERSLKRYRSAAMMLPAVTLNETLAAKLSAILSFTGESKSDFIRRTIGEYELPTEAWISLS